MKDLRSELRLEISDLRSELKLEIGELRSELKVEIGDVKIDLAAVKANVAILTWGIGLIIAGVIALVIKAFFV